MPALDATERQFIDLMRAAASKTVVRLLLFSIPEIPRADTMRQDMASGTATFPNCGTAHVDGLIVTGTEPRTQNLKDEPYWATLQPGGGLGARPYRVDHLVVPRGARRRASRPTASNAARSPTSCSAFSTASRSRSHPMTSDATSGLRVPHSRYNDLPERALTACGYRILTRSAVAGVDMFARQDKSFHLFLQGHPEYEARTLLREYRRDVGRYLRRERENYPALPLELFRRQCDGDRGCVPRARAAPIAAST